MKFSEISARYAKALFDFATEGGNQDKVFFDLRALADLMDQDSQIKEFLVSPLVKSDNKSTAFKEALKDAQVSDEVVNFVLLLAAKDRLALFQEVVAAYQFLSDEAHGVARGTVRSTTVLNPDQRKEIEEIVAKVIGKQVIMTYKEDPSVIGGLIAEVGSYTFDDTITSHLRRLKEDLTRRAH